MLGSLPQGNDNFSLGFRHGCYNAFIQAGYGFSRLLDYKYNKNTDLINNLEYNDGYNNGDRHCSVFVNRDIIL